MSKSERDPQADLDLCEAATPGPWNATKDEDGFCGVVNADGWVADVGLDDGDAAMIAASREALPWYIRAYLAQREEIDRLRTTALAEAHSRVREEVLGNLHHLGVTPHCDWQGHSVGQVVGCEVSALQMELEGVYAGIDQHGMEALNRQLQCQREEIERLRAELATQHNFQRGVECQFCGVSFDLPETDDDGELYRQHAMTCQKSPVVQEVERLKLEYAEEIDEFNAGYQAAKDGLPESAEPERCPHDVWRCGYAWGAFEGLKKDMKELQEDYLKEIDTNQLLRGEVDRLALVAQGAGEDCDKCGWRMRFPGEPCRCELDLEVERLRAENARLQAIFDKPRVMLFGDGREPTRNERHLANLLEWAQLDRQKMAEERSYWMNVAHNASVELDRLRTQSEESALARLREWRNESPENRRWTREEDWGAPTLELYQQIGEGEYRYVCVASGDTFAEQVEGALAEWERKYKGDESC